MIPYPLKTKKHNGLATISGFFTAILLLFSLSSCVGNQSSNENESSSAEAETEQPADNNQEIRDLLINNTFVNHEAGGSTYIKFSSDRGGWFGAMTMSMGPCDAVYGYNLDGRTIELTYTGSTCDNVSGKDETMTINPDNTISVIIGGQEFVFTPE